MDQEVNIAYQAFWLVNVIGGDELFTSYSSPSICRFIIGIKVLFWSTSQYSRRKLKQLSTGSVSVKEVDIYLHLGE